LATMSQKGGVKLSHGESQRGAVDPFSVLIRGLPSGTVERDLREFVEATVGPTVTCFPIKGDLGLAKFKDVTDARRCLDDLKTLQFSGSTVRFETAKPKVRRGKENEEKGTQVTKRTSASKGGCGKTTAATADETDKKGFSLQEVVVKGLPKNMGEEGLKKFVEEKLPGGCGLVDVRRLDPKAVKSDKKGKKKVKKTVDQENVTFIAVFRKEANALRAVGRLNGSTVDGCVVTASFLALELNQRSAKAGRLIVRNLSFSATEKQIRSAFGKLGKLEEISLPMKPDAKTNRGFCFVQFAESSVAEKAIVELNGTRICGRGVAVDWAVDASLYRDLENQEQRTRAAQDKENANAEEVDEGQDDDAENEEHDDEEEEEAEGDSQIRRDKTPEFTLNPASELDRMKGFLEENVEGNDKAGKKRKVEHGTDIEEDDDEDEDEEETGNKSNGGRTAGFDVDQGQTVFVRNVPFDAGVKDLYRAFGKFGRLASVKLVPHKTELQQHSGTAFVRFQTKEAAEAALAVEADAERRLKELSSFVKKTDKRELPAVEGFGVSLKGRRLIVKPAVKPEDTAQFMEDRNGKKGTAKEERKTWLHLMNVGDITDSDPRWEKLSKSEKKQREASIKERKFRMNNPNFLLHPCRLSVRNLPRAVGAQELRESVVTYLMDQPGVGSEGESKTQRRRKAAELLEKVDIVRSSDRRDESGTRRSMGFGFLTFKEHSWAVKFLEHLNDNESVFGKGRRPIVQFAIEDKRKLRMQRELFEKNAHKLSGTARGGSRLGRGAGRVGVAPADTVAGRGKGRGKGERDAEELAVRQRRKKARETEGGDKVMSRGQRQRAKRREEKAMSEERAVHKLISDEKWKQIKEEKAREEMLNRQEANKRKAKFQPDAVANAKVPRKATKGELNDDFELQAMANLRGGFR